MDLRLQFLESLVASGSDGNTYKVCAYERLARDVPLMGRAEQWESTGVAEYRLADSRPVEVGSDGVLRIPETGVVLTLRSHRAP
jgi:hypothetical protein